MQYHFHNKKNCLRHYATSRKSRFRFPMGILCPVTFFLKSCRFWDNVGKHGTAWEATYDSIIRCMYFTSWITKATQTLSLSLWICITHRFSTATMVLQTCFDATLYVHCMSCSFSEFSPILNQTWFSSYWIKLDTGDDDVQKPGVAERPCSKFVFKVPVRGEKKKKKTEREREKKSNEMLLLASDLGTFRYLYSPSRDVFTEFARVACIVEYNRWSCYLWLTELTFTEVMVWNWVERTLSLSHSVRRP